MARLLVTVLLAAVTAVFCASDSQADDTLKPNNAFPSFGTGPVEVRIYTEYFCGPCRDMKPHLEPVLRELIEEGKIRATFIDIPMPRAVPYIHYFLYALNYDNTMEHAFKVRGILFDLAGKQGKAEDIRLSFKENDISYSPYDLNPVLVKFNELLKTDAILRTPTMVICNGDSTMTYMGERDILAALEGIKKGDL
jgi:thiol-disulfide isomerase/thioredoxin